MKGFLRVTIGEDEAEFGDFDPNEPVFNEALALGVDFTSNGFGLVANNGDALLARDGLVL